MPIASSVRAVLAANLDETGTKVYVHPDVAPDFSAYGLLMLSAGGGAAEVVEVTARDEGAGEFTVNRGALGTAQGYWYAQGTSVTPYAEGEGGPPAGTILQMPFPTAPTGYMVADRSEISQTAYPELYSAIGDDWSAMIEGGPSIGGPDFNQPDAAGVRLSDSGSYTDHLVLVGTDGTIYKGHPVGPFSLVHTEPNGLQHVLDLGSGVVLACGYSGTILRSTDWGDTWSSVTSNTTEDLYRMALAGSNVVAVGTNGAAVNSTDDGATWTDQSANTGTSEHLWGVAGGSPAHIVGTNGAWLSTSDGASFSSHSPGVSSGINAIEALGTGGAIGGGSHANFLAGTGAGELVLAEEDSGGSPAFTTLAAGVGGNSVNFANAFGVASFFGNTVAVIVTTSGPSYILRDDDGYVTDELPVMVPAYSAKFAVGTGSTLVFLMDTNKQQLAQVSPSQPSAGNFFLPRPSPLLPQQGYMMVKT